MADVTVPDLAARLKASLLAARLENALRRDLEHVHRVAGTMAAGIGEEGTVAALQAGYFMAGALPRERVESMLVAALYALAAEKTGAQARGTHPARHHSGRRRAVSIETKIYTAIRVTCDGCATVALDYDTDHDWHFYGDGDLTGKPVVISAVPCVGCLDDWEDIGGRHLCPDCQPDTAGGGEA